MENTTTTPQSETPTSLSEREINRAVTNDPSLSSDHFVLGDRTFPIVDLGYDDHVLFMTHLQPVFESIVARVAEKQGISLPGIDVKPEHFSMGAITSLCLKTLPEMVCLMCRQTDPSMTVDEVKRLGKKPTTLAVAVMKQIKQTGMIKEYSDFFVQTMAMVKAA